MNLKINFQLLPNHLPTGNHWICWSHDTAQFLITESDEPEVESQLQQLLT